MTPASGPHTVLIVEDDEVTAELERRVLARAGRSTRLVRRAADAIALLDSETFGVVLLDYHLPDGDPWAVVSRAQARTPRVPVIVVTAMGNERIAAEALHHGVAEYLQKSDSFWNQLPELVDRVARDAQAEERVRRSDALFQLIAESASDIVATADLDGVIQEISPACRPMLGYEPEEMIGRPTLAFVHPEDRERLARAFSMKTHLRLTYRHVRRDGTHLWVEANSSVVRDKATGQAREIVAIVRDVHERKRAEDKFRALLEGSPEANVIVDRHGVIVLVNARAEQLFGYARDQLIGSPFEVLVPERLRGRIQVHLDERSSAIELGGRRQDGSEFPAEISFNRLETEGELLVSSTILDISDRKTLQDQQMLLQLGEQLPRFEDVPELVQFVANELGAYFEVERCLFAEIDQERGLSTVHGEYARSGPSQKGVYPIAAYTPGVLRDLEAGRIVSISDTAVDLRTADLYAERYVPIRIRAFAGVPLMRGGRWVANFFLTAEDSRHWTTREIQMLQALVERTWLWIEHVRMMHALRESERKYRHFIESTHEGVWEVGPDTRTRFVNPRMATLLGYAPGEMLGLPLDAFLDDEGRRLASLVWARRKAGIAESHEFKFRRKDGSALWARLESNALTKPSGEYDGSLAMVADVTEQRQAQADQQFMLELSSSLTVANDPADALRASVHGLGAHLAVERCLFAEVDEAAAIASVKAECRTESVTSLLGSFRLDVYPDSLPDLHKGRSLVVQDARVDPRTSAAYEKSYAPLDVTAFLIAPIHEHGRLAAALVLTSSIPRTWQPREIALAQSAAERTFLCVERLQNVAALRDMSKELERRVEARTRELQSALREKEVLLKEIHHRVKNNLQVISSLLNLQAMHVTDTAAQAMFAESQGRVQSIALVHEALYSSADLSSVDFVDYIHTLVNTVIEAQARPERQISTVVDAGSVRLPVGSAIPCGLIINELVTNSLKHAFRGRTRGEIRVSLHNRGPHRIELIVADDGVGLPADLDLRRVSTLGLDLVFTFAEQLGAEISVQSERGTAFTVIFQDHE